MTLVLEECAAGPLRCIRQSILLGGVENDCFPKAVQRLRVRIVFQKRRYNTAVEVLKSHAEPLPSLCNDPMPGMRRLLPYRLAESEPKAGGLRAYKGDGQHRQNERWPRCTPESTVSIASLVQKKQPSRCRPNDDGTKDASA